MQTDFCKYFVTPNLLAWVTMQLYIFSKYNDAFYQMKLLEPNKPSARKNLKGQYNSYVYIPTTLYIAHP